MSSVKRVVIAFGSNLGDRGDYIDRALIFLKDFVEIEKLSSVIETDPVGGPEQGKYFNGVLIGSTELSAAELLQKMLEIETNLGRVRTILNGPRTIDLDLIDYEQMIITSPQLTLPHPRAHERHFVIAPWLEVDPTASLVGIGAIAEIAKMNGWSI